MLFGFLHRVTIAIDRVTIAVIDSRETIIFMVLRSCQICKEIMQIFSSSICALCISAISPIFVVLQPNLQDMLAIVQKTCALHFVFSSSSLLLLACFQVGIM